VQFRSLKRFSNCNSKTFLRKKKKKFQNMLFESLWIVQSKSFYELYYLKNTFDFRIIPFKKDKIGILMFVGGGQEMHGGARRNVLVSNGIRRPKKLLKLSKSNYGIITHLYCT